MRGGQHVVKVDAAAGEDVPQIYLQEAVEEIRLSKHLTKGTGFAMQAKKWI